MSDEPIVPTSSNGNPQTERRRRPTGGSSSGNAGGFVSTILLIVAVVGLGLLGWMTWQQHSQLQQAGKQINVLTAEVANLKQDFEVTGSELAESDDDVAESVKLWESETRKLWDLYNNRIKGDVATLENANAQTKNQISAFQNTLDEMQTNMIVQNRSLQDTTDSMNLLDQQTAQKVATLESKVRNNEETIDAIDRSRAANNSRILELERKVRELANQP